MDQITEKGFFYAHTYGLDKEELYQLINTEIVKLDLKDKNYNLIINVVKNSNGDKLGYTYFWIDNIKIFNALVGLNFDGSERVERTEEIITKDVEIDLNKDDWADLAQEEEIKVTIEKLEPLIKFPIIKLKDGDKYKYKFYNDEFNLFIEPTTVFKNYNLKNSLYAKNVPSWLSEEKIREYFKCFEKDIILHSRKNERFKYPIVKIKNSIVNIIFSNINPNTASFVYNMSRIVIFKDKIITTKDNKNIEEKEVECLLKFKQNIKRN